jgi:thiosulfate/3-mercaptopyruvate sulfurtransferase
MINPLVAPLWLAERRADPKIKVLDASWYLPQAGRDPKTEFAKAHIPGAQFFDLDTSSDETSPWPHMLPPAAKFEQIIGDFGIDNDTTVLVYDTAGLFSAPRLWWSFLAMGHDKVRILDGGLPAWKRVDYPLRDTPTTKTTARFVASPNRALVTSFDAMLDIVKTGSAQIIDARGAPRFFAQEPEPRPSVRGGHMPGAINIHYAQFLTPDGTLKAAADLTDLFAAKGVALDKPIVTSCGSGVTAAIAMLALTVVGAQHVSLYDGSWAEWGARPEAPIETGAV